jgi:hypothetical protein
MNAISKRNKQIQDITINMLIDNEIFIEISLPILLSTSFFFNFSFIFVIKNFHRCLVSSYEAIVVVSLNIISIQILCHLVQ